MVGGTSPCRLSPSTGGRFGFVAANTTIGRSLNMPWPISLACPGPQARVRTWTVRRWLEDWLVEKESRLRPSAPQAYRSVVRTHLIPPGRQLSRPPLRVADAQRRTPRRSRFRGGIPAPHRPAPRLRHRTTDSGGARRRTAERGLHVDPQLPSTGQQQGAGPIPARPPHSYVEVGCENGT